MDDRPVMQVHNQQAPPATTQRCFELERELEDATMRMIRTHAGGLATADLFDLVRDVTNAADACRVAGTTQESVCTIIEDTFGAYADKKADRDAIKAATKNAT